MDIHYHQGEEADRISREIADTVGVFCEQACLRMVQAGMEPMEAAALAVAGLLRAVGDGVGTQAAMCRLDWTKEDISRLHNELQAAVHKAQMEIHARVNGRTN